MDFHIICLTETWLNECFEIFTTQFIVFLSDRVSRTTCRGGGDLIAISSRIHKFKCSYDLPFHDECFWVEIFHHNGRNLLMVITIPPPPIPKRKLFLNIFFLFCGKNLDYKKSQISFNWGFQCP